jgi:hypothetical protein
MSQTKAQLIDDLVQPIKGALGSASAPAFSFTSDPNTGIFSPGADTLSICEGGVETMRFASDGSMSSVVPGGTTLYPASMCRAWVNFNGTGTVAIRASNNVSSITDNGVGDYTVNFATEMPDANYAPCLSHATSYGVTSQVMATGSAFNPTLQSTTSLRVTHDTTAGTGRLDVAAFYVAIFR